MYHIYSDQEDEENLDLFCGLEDAVREAPFDYYILLVEYLDGNYLDCTVCHKCLANISPLTKLAVVEL